MDLAFIHIGPSLAILVAFLSLTLWNSLEARNALNVTQSTILDAKIVETRDEITNRFKIYENITRAGAGLFEASDSVSRSEWKSFIDTINPTEQYPGITSMSYIKVIQPSELAQHVASVRLEGYSNYAVTPVGDRNLYTSIYFIEPGNDSNIGLLGSDTYTEKNRKDAMDTASKTNTATVSEPIKSLSVPSVTIVNMYVPVYDKGSTPVSEAERISSLDGYVVATLRTSDLFKNTSFAGIDESRYGFRLTDNDSAETFELVRNDAFDTIISLDSKNNKSITFPIFNQEWVLTGLIDPEIVSVSDRNRPVNILWAGSLFSVLFAVLIYTLLVNRTQNLEKKENLDIQYAKDELLALASHQLRTPATGVKQYIGMLKEGYAGKLSAEQRKYINKAYDSNERQLSTINEMLVVAHADSGKMDLNIQRVDIAGLLKEIIAELKPSFAEKEQKLETLVPKRGVYAEIDQRYVRMAIENIVSNANKYTDVSGTIKVTMHTSHGTVTIKVKDNGVGINHQDFPLLFKKFSRIPNELTNKVTGSGIGLYLGKKIIDAHAGTIEYNSRKNRGSEFVILLPLKRQ